MAVCAAAWACRAVPWGDQAVLQLSVDRAWRGAQLVGPYSRFGWSHPGPDVFYLLALPYRVLGSSAAALMAASALLAAAWGVATVLMARRWFPPAGPWWAAAAVVAGWAALGPATVAEAWNPVWVIAPTATFLVAAAALAGGRPWALPWAVAVGSLVVQSDVSTAPVVAAVGVVALGAAVVSWRRAADRPLPAGEAGRAVAASVVTVGVLWAAPVAQQLVGPGPGNLSALAQFLTAAHPTHTIAEATRATAGALWPPFRGRLAGAPPPTPAAAAVVALMAGAAALLAGVGWRRRLPVAAAAGGVVLVALVAAVGGATRATGDLFPYLTEWVSALWVPLVAGAGCVVGGWRAWPPRWAMIAAAGAGVAVLAQVAFVPPAGPTPGSQVATLWASARGQLPAPGDGPVEVRLAAPARWPWAAGLLVELTHAGWRAAAQPQWLFLFGQSFAPVSKPAAIITVTDARRGGGPAVTVARG